MDEKRKYELYKQHIKICWEYSTTFNWFKINLRRMSEYQAIHKRWRKRVDWLKLIKIPDKTKRCETYQKREEHKKICWDEAVTLWWFYSRVNKWGMDKAINTPRKKF